MANTKLETMKKIFGITFAALFIVLAIGVYITSNLPVYVGIIYWVFIAIAGIGMMGIGFFYVKNNLARKDVKVVNSEWRK